MGSETTRPVADKLGTHTRLVTDIFGDHVSACKVNWLLSNSMVLFFHEKTPLEAFSRFKRYTSVLSL